ncbi:MAG: polysaccharide biosynthesis protein, partial [Bacteroidia bacterium]
IQTFRYAADPFFFAKAKEQNAKQTYAQVMHWFVIVGSFVFLATTMLIDIVQYFIGKDYRGGLDIVPILLMANLFLGIYYNLSFWYKLSNKTVYGAWFSIIGAVVSVVLILLVVPRWGIYGAAVSVMGAYLVPMLLSLYYGRKYYPIPYRLAPMFLYPLGVAALYAIVHGLDLSLIWRVLILVGFMVWVFYAENVKDLLPKRM